MTDDQRDSPLILTRRFTPTDPRLKRHVRHDPRSRRYAYPTDQLQLVSTRHARVIPILDQGQLGSCTGNAGVGNLGTQPFYQDLVTAGLIGNFDSSEAGAVTLYSAATQLSSPGDAYPPNDVGSDGLSIAQVLKTWGLISGYLHTFTLDDALKALTVTPWICGISWYQQMFYPDSTGQIHPSGGSLAGGHELVATELDVENERVWLDNSWGVGWGINGRCWLSFADFGTLLADQGDVTIFVPVTVPAPVPTPAPAPTPVPPAPVPVPPTPVPDPPAPVIDADHTFAVALRKADWLQDYHFNMETVAVVEAAKAWLASKGL